MAKSASKSRAPASKAAAPKEVAPKSAAGAGDNGASGNRPMRHLYLVDGSGYLFRAYHALPPMTRPHPATSSWRTRRPIST